MDPKDPRIPEATKDQFFNYLKEAGCEQKYHKLDKYKFGSQKREHDMPAVHACIKSYLKNKFKERNNELFEVYMKEEFPKVVEQTKKKYNIVD